MHIKHFGDKIICVCPLLPGKNSIVYEILHIKSNHIKVKELHLSFGGNQSAATKRALQWAREEYNCEFKKIKYKLPRELAAERGWIEFQLS